MQNWQHDHVVNDPIDVPVVLWVELSLPDAHLKLLQIARVFPVNKEKEGKKKKFH